MTAPQGVPVVEITPSSQPSAFEKYEMWVAKILAALLTAAYATGLIPTTGTTSQIAGMIAAMLAFAGFTVVKARQS